MKVILLGASGQLGKYILENMPSKVKIITPTRDELDLAKCNEVYEYFVKNKADWVVNSAAFTNVDNAEKDKELALKINAYAPEKIAKALLETGGKLLQISTDYVFKGDQSVPYKTKQNIAPCNFYGLSKAEGENLLRSSLTSNNQLSIVRTSWLMSPYRNNFAVNMLNLLKERDRINVVYDQIGSPTSAQTLAIAIWKMIEVNDMFSDKKINFPEINHFADDGIASWYDVAVSLYEIGVIKGLIKNQTKIIPIRSSDYPTPAIRPLYSVLETQETKKLLNISGINWRHALFKTFKVDLRLGDLGKNE